MNPEQPAMDPGQPGPLVREESGTFVPTEPYFVHRRCCARGGGVCGTFLCLCVFGRLLEVFVSALCAGCLLALSPSCIIIAAFYRRYKGSTSPWQILFTFLEAILWMVPLILVIRVIDPIVDLRLSVPTNGFCTWNMSSTTALLEDPLEEIVEAKPRREHGQRLLWYLSAAASCNAGTKNFALKGKCKVGDASVEFPAGLRINEGGLMTVQTLLQIEQRSYETENGLLQAGCLAEHLAEASQSFAVSFVSFQRRGFARHEHAEESLVIDDSDGAHMNRQALAEAYDDAFRWRSTRLWSPQGRLYEFSAGCPCLTAPLERDAESSQHCKQGQNCTLDASLCFNTTDNRRVFGECPVQEEEPLQAEFAYHRTTFLHALVMAYFRAAFLEETLKYLAVRRILFMDRVLDGGGLLVYGAASAAGFAAIENAQYALTHGVIVTYLRMLISIPLHCCTGIIIGEHLGYRKFLDRSNCGFFTAIAVPVLIHGTFDFGLMVPAPSPPREMPLLLLYWLVLLAVKLVLPLCTLLFGFWYARYAWRQLDSVCLVDVGALQREGRLSYSRSCFCEICGSFFCGAQPKPCWQRFRDSICVPSTGCQTVETRCGACHRPVRAHAVFSSRCPYCLAPCQGRQDTDALGIEMASAPV